MEKEKRKEIRQHILEGAVLDSILLCIGRIILDGGFILSITFSLAAGHWVGSAILIIRRGEKMTSFDIGFVKFGMLGMAVIAIAVGHIVVMVKGSLFVL